MTQQLREDIYAAFADAEEIFYRDNNSDALKYRRLVNKAINNLLNNIEKMPVLEIDGVKLISKRDLINLIGPIG